MHPRLVVLIAALVCACAPAGPPPSAPREPIERQRASATPPPRQRQPEARAPARATSAPKPMRGVLDTHNQHRARHCSPRLAWSRELAAYATAWAQELARGGCRLEHRSRSPYGENLAFFGPPGSLSPEDVVDMWYREVEQYSFARPGFSMQTGHFSQLVWADTARVGCASSQCGGGELWVCNYDPPGNVDRGYQTNVQRAGCSQ